jgi:hypothetical protein
MNVVETTKTTLNRLHLPEFAHEYHSINVFAAVVNVPFSVQVQQQLLLTVLPYKIPVFRKTLEPVCCNFS